MIDLLMYQGTELIFIRINGTNVGFSTSSNRAIISDISGLKLDYNGVVKEFPELKDCPTWRIEAISRFKDKLKELKNEEAIEKYLVQDLKKFGFTPYKRMKAGFRDEKL